LDDDSDDEENGGPAYLVNSTVADNIGFAGQNGVGIFAPDAATAIVARGSTISGNSGDAVGGGIYSEQGVVDLVNSTVSGNSANVGAGIAVITGTLSLDFSTVADNTATSGAGGLYNGGATIIKNSIVAGNSANSNVNEDTADCQAAAPLTFAGYSLFGSGTGCEATGFNDQAVAPAMVWTAVLDPLTDNDGDTETHALQDGSPALDIIPTEDCSVITDQRGVERPYGRGCDVGAYEINYSLLFLPLINR